MTKKVFSILSLLVLLIVVLSVGIVSAQDDDRARTAIFDIDGGRVENPEVWNPYVPGSRRDHGFHQSMIEPLFILNYETGEITSWLGASMTPNETLDVWTLTLRDGVMWSDGEAFNADDVVFSINLLLNPENITLNDAGSMQNWVEAVTKVDDLTVEFDLMNANPRFQLDYFSVRIWGGVNIVPEHIWADQDPNTFTNYDPEQGWPVFTGPYTLESTSNTEFVYARNDAWWGVTAGVEDLPAPERLIWTWAGPEEARAALMADNGLDSLMDVTIGTFEALQGQNPNVVAWLTSIPFASLDPCARNLEFNTTVAPWDDTEMRWAVNYAINRDEIVAIAYEGTTIASRSFFPAYAPLNNYLGLLDESGAFEENPLMTHDAARAEEIIQSKGYVKGDDGYYALDGEQLSLDITTHEAFIEKQRIAAVMVEQLQRVGINASTRNEAGATWDDNFRRGNFEARLGWQNCGSVNEPWASMNTLNQSWIEPVGELTSFNGWRWSNDRYSELVDQIGQLPLGSEEINPLFVEAMTIYLSELPTIPITQARKLVPFNTTYWTGWPTAENNYFQGFTWWQSTHPIIHNLQPAGE